VQKAVVLVWIIVLLIAGVLSAVGRGREEGLKHCSDASGLALAKNMYEHYK